MELPSVDLFPKYKQWLGCGQAKARLMEHSPGLLCGWQRLGGQTSRSKAESDPDTLPRNVESQLVPSTSEQTLTPKMKILKLKNMASEKLPG